MTNLDMWLKNIHSVPICLRQVELDGAYLFVDYVWQMTDFRKNSS